MKKIFIMVAALLITAAAQAQTIESVLSQIEANNSSLKALGQELEAARSTNLASAALPNPEVEFAYMWGAPEAIGNRKNLNITQSVDFAALTGARGAVIEQQNALLSLQYKAGRVELLTQARKLCVELIYQNALRKEYAVRLEHAQKIAVATEAGLKSGGTNVLESNKAKMNLSTAQGELQMIDVQRQNLLAELAALNGGKAVSLDTDSYPQTVLPQDFEAWYSMAAENSPALQYARGESRLGKEQIRMSKAEALPTVSAGYTSEVLVGESFRGIAAGISIPLWSGRNKVRSARLAASAAESRETDLRNRFRVQTESLFNRTAGLQEAARNYRATLSDTDNTALLLKALEAGQISLLDYMVEISLYYDTVSRALETERDFRLSLAELQALEM